MKNRLLILAGAAALLLPLFGQRTATPQWKGIWEPVSYPDDIHFFDVFFSTPDEGWVGGGLNQIKGGVIIHTSDGGNHWDVQYGDPQSADRAVGEFRFIDATHGWAVQATNGANRLLHTRDGKLWTLAGTIDRHDDYMFTSETNGISVSRDIKITRDGGQTWQPVFPCAAKIQVNGLFQNVDCEWRRLHFVSSAVAYAVANNAFFKNVLFLGKTTDGGATWSMTTQETTGSPQDIFFIDENTGYFRAGGPDTGQVFKTTDGGRTWTGMATSPGNRMQFADPDVGWAVLYRKVSFTTDGGTRWNSREYSFPANVEAFSLPRRDRGYVVGEHGMIFRYRIVPFDYSAKGMIPAPLLSGIESPLESNVQRLVAQVNKICADAGLPPMNSPLGTAPPAAPAGFSQDMGQAQTALDSVSAEIPRFAAKYRNLNLRMVGYQVTSQMGSQAQDLQQSFSGLRNIQDPNAAKAPVTEIQTKMLGFVQTVQIALQKTR